MDAHRTFLIVTLAVLAVAGYAVHRLTNAPARIAAVLIALAALVGALQPIGALLNQSEQSSVETVAPPVPPSASETAPHQPAALPSTDASNPSVL
ncbi:hypothetical protein ACFV0T_39685 [Streptomyces sp. NPDC059582]|uniref:hypothetical protein n=1 Tax=Streptomyces sp. NPDC059582 TaxID=3346875 RepID=UPI0036C867CA